MASPVPTPIHFADRLLASVEVIGAPTCVGLDPVLDWMPADVREAAAGPVDAVETFCRSVLDVITGTAPVVKLQSACFERYGAEGVGALSRTMAHARQLGFLTILDAKRGDIGLTAEHYAAAAFSPRAKVDADALTVNAYLGMDTLAPYLDAEWAGAVARDGRDAARGRGVFVLVRTSNPGSDMIQRQKLADGRTIAELMADEVVTIGEGRIGGRGYSSVGAVIGATKPEDAAAMRARMPHQLFLVPGYGAQGGSGATVRELFNPARRGEALRTGAVVTASRSIIYPLIPDGMDWTSAVRDAAERFAEEIRAVAAA